MQVLLSQETPYHRLVNLRGRFGMTLLRFLLGISQYVVQMSLQPRLVRTAIISSLLMHLAFTFDTRYNVVGTLQIGRPKYYPLRTTSLLGTSVFLLLSFLFSFCSLPKDVLVCERYQTILLLLRPFLSVHSHPHSGKESRWIAMDVLFVEAMLHLLQNIEGTLDGSGGGACAQDIVSGGTGGAVGSSV